MRSAILTNAITGKKNLVNISPENWCFAEPFEPPNPTPIIGEAPPPLVTKLWFQNGKFLIVRETIEQLDVIL